MWTPDRIQQLRLRLGLDPVAFAKLLGVDLRTVRRWEGGQAAPSGTSEAVLTGLEASVGASGNAELVKMIVSAAAVGGLAYLLVRLLEHVREGEVR